MGEALKTFSFPVGGIANFYLEDHEKEALYKEKAQENFGSDGLGAIHDVAVRMASYGRYGDDKLVHAETGELVVPKALIDKNPKLKESIFSHLKDMGIEDPERYVVGTEANSINPETGLPEFFLKDIFDKVGDVIRKVAKPVLTVAGAVVLAPFVGPTVGASIGAGIGGLIQGESFEQALGSALTAGATSTIGAGISGMFGGAGFTEGVKAGFTPVGQFGKIGETLGAMKISFTPEGVPKVAPVAKVVPGMEGTVNIPQQGTRFIDKLMPKTFTASDLAAANPTIADKLTPEISSQILKDVNPGFLAKYAAPTAAATTLAAGTGFFDAPKQDELEKLKTGQDLIDENRDKFFVQNIGPRVANPPFLVPTRFPLRQAPTQVQPPVQFAAAGGEAGGTKEFPRRNGGIGMDEGTPGKDSVRAMLMPGEFVMTTDAVNGAGGGDNEKGIQNMYAMMRNFEAKARA